MKINIIKTFVTSLLVTTLVVPVLALAQVPAADGQDSGGATSPAAEGQNTGGATASNSPAAEGQGIGGATSGSSSNVPSAEGQNTGGGTTAGSNGGSGVPSSEGQNTGGGTTAGGSSNNGGGNGSGGNGNGSGGVGSTGGSTSSSGSSGSISSGGSRVTVLPLLVNISQCNYMTDYLKIGKNNPVEQVNRLQTFLKTNEGLNVDVTGFFDQKTFDAVKAFQAKYVNDVMLPWGVRTPTGQVYYTTRKKINELYCKKTFSLTPAQIAEIEAYRTSRINGETPASEDVGINEGTNTDSTDISSSTSTTTELASDNGTSTDTQTAAAGGTSLARRLWNFIKFIFGRY